jgi:hypothetical protein
LLNQLLVMSSDDGGSAMSALAKRIEIGREDRAELARIVRSGTSQVRMVERAQIVLGAAEGHSAGKIGRPPGVLGEHGAEVACALRARWAFGAQRLAEVR